jgi:putative endonuclease
MILAEVVIHVLYSAPDATYNPPHLSRSGGMADAADSKSAEGNLVGVRLPPSAFMRLRRTRLSAYSMMNRDIYIYVLKGKQYAVRYVGITNNLERRMIEHRTHADTVKKRLGDIEIMLVEQYSDYATARQREKWLKSGLGRAWLDEQERLVGPAKGG